MPQFSQKQDAVPGQHNTLVITPTRLGTFPVICTELCGLGHALMRSHVDVVSDRAKFAAFMKGGGAGGCAGPDARLQQNGCGSCHTFTPAGATGKIGPDLDDLKTLAAKANRGPLDKFIEESIVDPTAYIAPGYQDLMPHIFKHADPGEPVAAARAVSRPGSEVEMTDVAHVHEPRPRTLRRRPRRAGIASPHPAGCASSG